MTVRRSIVATPRGALLVVDAGRELACLSSAVLGGGLRPVRTWVNLQVPSGYAGCEPAEDIASAAAGLPGPVTGMMTAAPVDQVQEVARGTAHVFATVGLGHPIAAAGHRPAGEALPGTINLFAIVGVPLSAAGLAGGLQTAVEAKAQALAAAGIAAANADGPATGTASDAIAVACPVPARGDAGNPFCGPATRHGADLAQAVFHAVLQGCPARRASGPGRPGH